MTSSNLPEFIIMKSHIMFTFPFSLFFMYTGRKTGVLGTKILKSHIAQEHMRIVTKPRETKKSQLLHK